MQTSIYSAALIAASFALGCSGEPFAVADRDSDAGADASDAGVDRAAPAFTQLEPNLSVAAVHPADVRLAFAAHGPSSIGIFDSRSGAVLFDHPIDGIVADLDWDRSSRRLLAVIQSPEADGARVQAFELGEQKLAGVASSQALAAETRVFSLPPRVLALSEDVGTSWSLFDAMLNPEAPSKAIVKPSGLLVTHSMGRSHAVALNPYAQTDEGDADEIFDVSFEGTWTITSVNFEAPGRPGSRLARANGRDEAYVVRKHVSLSKLELGEFLVVDPSAPKNFVHYPLDGGEGELEAALVDPSGEVLFALLSRGADPGALALVPIRKKFRPKLFQLSAPVEHSPWRSRAITLSDSGELWVATTAGVAGYRFTQSGDEPSISPIGIATELLAPLGLFE